MRGRTAYTVNILLVKSFIFHIFMHVLNALL